MKKCALPNPRTGTVDRCATIFTEAEIKLSNGDTLFIIHDLPDVPGLRLEDALNNWLARTEIFTDWSFAQYINSKGSGHVAYTRKQFRKLNIKK